MSLILAFFAEKMALFQAEFRQKMDPKLCFFYFTLFKGGIPRN